MGEKKTNKTGQKSSKCKQASVGRITSTSEVLLGKHEKEKEKKG